MARFHRWRCPWIEVTLAIRRTRPCKGCLSAHVCPPRPGSGRRRQTEHEAGAAFGPVVGREAAAMILGDSPRNRQAQSQTGLLATDERFEKPRQYLRRDARSAVNHPKLDPVIRHGVQSDF